MNNLIIKGRLTATPELKNTSNATEYCDFTVAVDRFAGKDKERETDFVPCRAWRQTAVFVKKYFKKGQEILVSGEIRFDKYEKDGEKRTYAYMVANRIEFCGDKRNEENSSEGSFTAVASDDGDLPF